MTDATGADARATKELVVWAAQEMLRSGLVEGTAGNIGARLPDGNVVEGDRSPTSEKALHLATLRRFPELGATMHCHALHATMFDGRPPAKSVASPSAIIVEWFASVS